jgi:uncharacterized protein YmfQ (DUF2313 family)
MPDAFEIFPSLILDLLPSGPVWDKSDGSELAETAEKLGNIFIIDYIFLQEFEMQLSPEKCLSEVLFRYQDELKLQKGKTKADRDKAQLEWVKEVNVSLQNMVIELKKLTGIEPIINEFTPSFSGKTRCGSSLRGPSFMFVIQIENVPINDNSKAVIRKYLQAHIACFLTKPDKTLERFQ